MIYSSFALSTLLLGLLSDIATTSTIPLDQGQQVLISAPNVDNSAPPESHGKSKGKVGRLPALGWNSWNHFRCDINEEKILDMVQRMVDLGLKDVGYEYINIDDCWSIREYRDPKTKYMVPDPDRFPNGISGLAEKIHELGLKIGIYSSAGLFTCAGYPASLGYEEIDAKAFAEWGIDYLKYDNCGVPPEWQDDCRYCQELNSTCKDDGEVKYCPPDYDYSTSKTAERYNRMRDALNKQHRPILYSLCEWGTAGVQNWANQTAQSWRSTDDIENDWNYVLINLNRNSFYLNQVNFWSHADPDMLEVGNDENGPGLTYAQERSHFALWAAMKSPLLIGANLNKINKKSLDILKTKTLLEFNQDDEFGASAKPFNWDWKFDDKHPPQYWSGRYRGGILILLFNNSSQKKHMTVYTQDVKEMERNVGYQLVDGWTGKVEFDCIEWEDSIRLSVDAFDTAVLVLKEQKSCKIKSKEKAYQARELDIEE